MFYLSFGFMTLLVPTVAFMLYWNRFKVLKRRFNYRITDIWAATLCLTPSLALAAAAIDVHGDNRINVEFARFLICAASGLAVYLVVGVVIGRLNIEFRERELGPITDWSSAVSIVTGGVFGILAGSIIIPFAFGFSLSVFR